MIKSCWAGSGGKHWKTVGESFPPPSPPPQKKNTPPPPATTISQTQDVTPPPTSPPPPNPHAKISILPNETLPQPDRWTMTRLATHSSQSPTLGLSFVSDSPLLPCLSRDPCPPPPPAYLHTRPSAETASFDYFFYIRQYFIIFESCHS